jgi:hypothetical protein
VKAMDYSSIPGTPPNPTCAIKGIAYLNDTKGVVGEAHGASNGAYSVAIYGWAAHYTAWSGYFDSVAGAGGRGVYVSNKIGIGVTSPSESVETNGNIKGIGLIICSSTAPVSTVTGMLWYDASTNRLKIRNIANNNWNTVFQNT